MMVEHDTRGLITLDLIESLLAIHDFHCIFELDAPMKIFNRLMDAGIVNVYSCDTNGVKKYRECFKLSEIYCPHEGIDRRNDYGMETV